MTYPGLQGLYSPSFPLFPFFWPGSGNGGLDPSLLIIPVDTVNAGVSEPPVEETLMRVRSLPYLDFTQIVFP
jgi:hypothetical protein